MIALSEITRRGIWTLFRVENEHCTNVGRFRASRDVPLPYEISTPPSPIGEDEGDISTAQTTSYSPESARRRSGTLESGRPTTQDSPSLRNRVTNMNFTDILANAHWKDFEKKRKPGGGDSQAAKDDEDERSSDEDDGISAGEERDEEDMEGVKDMLGRHGKRRDS